MSEISRDRRAPGPLLAALIAVALGGALVAGAIVAAPSRSSTGFECDGIHGRSGSGFYERNPTYVDRSGDASDWARSTPEAEGIDPERLGRGIDRIARNPAVRSVLVVRHDRLVVERYPNGGAANHADNIHSASKSMLQALLGIAIERGLIGDIDDPVASYLPRYFAEASARKRRITIRDLISMSSGLR